MRIHGIRHVLLRIIAAQSVMSVLFSPGLATPVYGQSDTIRFENISSEEGLSQNTVNAILQDQQGFLWFATEGGLNQYDGYQFTVYQHDFNNAKSLSNNFIDSLYEDLDGSLWIGTSTGLDRFDRKTGSFVHYPQDITGSDSLSGAAVTAMGQEPSGALLVGTQGAGLEALDLTTQRITKFNHHSGDSESLSSDTINSIYKSPDGELWIGTNAGLDLFDSKTGSFEHSLQASLASRIGDNVQVRTVFEDGQGMMWIGTLNGLIQWDRAANRSVLYQHDPNDPHSLSDNAVESISEDSQGTLWIGTLKGLNQFDKIQNRFINYLHDPNDPSSLSSDYIRSVFEDRSGVLWIGTSDGGLNKYPPSTQKFALYNNHPGLPNNLSDYNIWSVYKDQSNNLWIGTFFSGLNKLDLTTGKVTVYQNDPSNPMSLSDNEIRAILQDSTGALWVGTEHGGLNRFDPATGTFARYEHHPDDPTSLISESVFSLYTDHLGRLWIGTENGGLDRFDQASGTFIHYQHDVNDPLSLSDVNVRAIYQDHTGALWIGTEQGGLDLWDNQDSHFKIYKYDPKDPSSLSNNWVLSILEDQAGTLWIGTLDGLNRLDRSTQSFTHYTVKDGLPDNIIYGILAGSDGSLWLSTSKGLSKFNPGTGTFRNYDVSDGLQGEQFNPGAYFQSQDGEMFFGGAKGLNAFFPQQVKDNPIPPPVVITSFMKYNQVIQTDLGPNEAIQLSYRDNFISFEFAALDYNAPEKNQYAYQLEGVDKDWVYAGTRHYASYTNLRGGNYIFRVKAANNDGIWNQQATTLRIYITPPFWQTFWFWGIIGLVIAGGAFGGYRLRVRDMEARNRELVKRVEQRTHELATLNSISSVIIRSLDLTEILKDALDHTLEAIHMDMGLAYRLDEPSGGPADEPSLSLLAHRGLSEDFLSAVRTLPLDESLIAAAAEAGKPIVQQADTHPRLQIANEREGIKLIISVPLLVKGKLVGGISLGAGQSRLITPEELSMLAAIGRQVSLAVENARLYEQAEQTAVATERNRLARELHDSVTQLLYSVTLYAEAMSELLASGKIETASGHLHKLRDTAQEALREMRLLIFELHQPALGPAGLAAALQSRLDAVETRGGVHAELLVEGSEELPPQVQAELYNIAQEALNNALKHAHANQVRIHLRFKETITEMEISDDGVGFDPTPDRMGGGYGITGMNERSRKIGGTIQIESSPGKGTKVIVSVPVNPQKEME